MINFVQDDDTWTKDDAQATVTVYVDQEGKIIKTEPECAINEGSLTINLREDVELTGWEYTPILTVEGDLTAEPTISGDDISSFSIMINEYGNLFITALDYSSSQLPASIKVKIENEETAGYLAINFTEVKTITEENITKGGEGNLEEGELLYGDGKHVIYDGNSHGLDALVLNDGTTLSFAEDHYSVSYYDNGTLINGEPVDAGTYTATVVFDPTSGYIGTIENLSIRIDQRPLELTFKFDPIFEEGEALDYTIDAVGLANDESIDNAIEATFRIADEANDEGKYNVYIENLLIHKTDNFDPENYEIGYAYDNTVIYLSHGEGDTYIPTGGEGIFEESPVGEIEDIVDPSGESSSGSGIRYNKYKLFLANDNYQISEEEKDAYADEELTLHSRHDKYSTWAGGSFTVWYEHGDKVNDGEYRIFISKNRKDWTELKIDTVSDLYQIRNVQSDIYVKIYGLSGYPVANEEISTTDARAYSQANKIVVITPEPTDVQIISMTGAVVATDQVTGQREFANLMEGIYIVRMGDAVVKLQVRN